MRQGKDFGVSAASRLLLTALPLLLSVSCTANRRAVPVPEPSLRSPLERGVASWYGPGFHGRRTANGERFDMNDMTAAHPSLPFGTRLKVRNVRTGQTVTVRVNDRGPFKKNRILDLSYAAARAAGVYGPGTAFVEIFPAGSTTRLATARDAVPDTRPDDLTAARFTVQVGAFSDTERAVALHRDIKTIFPEVYVHSDGTWNRVQVGLFSERDQAESLRRELAAMGMSSVVVATR